jgi:tellurite resistance protein TerC
MARRFCVPRERATKEQNSMDVMLWLWVGFNVFVLAMLALDLGVFHRTAHVVSFREAAIWSTIWIGMAGVFNVLLFFFWEQWSPGSEYTSSEAALLFLTGYIIEKSLSIDNIFVFVLIFTYFAVPREYQHRVLFWGILGALVMRGAMIAAGAALIERFGWVVWIFGAFLIFTGIKMAFHRNEKIDPEKNPLIRLFRRFMPVTEQFHGDKFFVRKAGVLMATPLFLALLMVEFTDLVFAVDSIPAIFAVTRDPFIVYTANVMAILGLRSLYFLLDGLVHQFYYLKLGLSFILVFAGVKLFWPDVMALVTGTASKMPPAISLGVIAAVLAVAIGASLVRARRLARQKQPGIRDELRPSAE